MKNLKRDELLLKLGAAKQDAGNTWKLVDIQLPGPRPPVTPAASEAQIISEGNRAKPGSSFTFNLNVNCAKPGEAKEPTCCEPTSPPEIGRSPVHPRPPA